MNDDAFTCACYFDQVGNIPKKGDYLSWAESSAVVYANSVLGARCNRNSGIMDIMGSIAKVSPYMIRVFITLAMVSPFSPLAMACCSSVKYMKCLLCAYSFMPTSHACQMTVRRLPT